MFGAMPKEWILTFEYDGRKAQAIVVARTLVGARGFAPTGATNVKVRTCNTPRRTKGTTTRGLKWQASQSEIEKFDLND